MKGPVGGAGLADCRYAVARHVSAQIPVRRWRGAGLMGSDTLAACHVHVRGFSWRFSWHTKLVVPMRCNPSMRNSCRLSSESARHAGATDQCDDLTPGWHWLFLLGPSCSV